MSFKKKNHSHFCDIYIINTNTVIQSHFDLGFHCFYLKITWTIHGIACHQRSGNPGYTSLSVMPMYLCLIFQTLKQPAPAVSSMTSSQSVITSVSYSKLCGRFPFIRGVSFR